MKAIPRREENIVSCHTKNNDELSKINKFTIKITKVRSEQVTVVLLDVFI